MENRTILAFVLSFLVLIGWSVLFGPKQEHAPENVTNTNKQVEEGLPDVQHPSNISHNDLSQGSAGDGFGPEVEEREVRVDTPLYIACFTNVGPALKSFKLKQYRQGVDPDSPMVELFAHKKGRDDFLYVSFDNTAAATGGMEGGRLICDVDTTGVTLHKGDSPKVLVFRAVTKNGLMIRQTYRFYPDRYKIDLTIDVANSSDQPARGTFRADVKVFPPAKKKGYYSYVGLVGMLDDKLEKIKTGKKSDQKVFKGRIDWIAYEDAYFISAVIPEKKVPGIFKGAMLSTGLLEGSYIGQYTTIEPEDRLSSSYTLYLGPRDLEILKRLGKGLDRAVNFGWTDIIARPLLYTLRFFNRYVNNYGISIILLTVLVKIIFWPLTRKSYQSMKQMQKLQPMMARIREKYKDNREQLNREMMALYKTYKVNPLGGCLPMIIQIPVFFALFRILGSAIELRHAPFMFWINDLSAPDRLFNFAFKIPFMSPPYGIPVLTLLMGASMFIQQKMTPTPGDPTQAKLMMFLPVIFTFMFINFPSGLVLYWLVNNILSIGQQYQIQKRSA